MDWLKRLLTRCGHEHVRCIHGDEINHANGRRARCLDCGRALDQGLPEPCTVTNRPHGRDRNFLPGDEVHIALSPTDICQEFNGRDGIVVHGPDKENGWLVSSAPGTLRCVASELTMVTRREDR